MTREHRAALLTAPRTELAVTALPAEVRVYLRQFPDALEVEARRLLVGGVSYFELLRVHAYEDAEDDATFLTGTIVGATGSEIAELDFVERTATFMPSPVEVERDQRLSRFAERHFTPHRLETGRRRRRAGALRPVLQPGAGRRHRRRLNSGERCRRRRACR